MSLAKFRQPPQPTPSVSKRSVLSWRARRRVTAAALGLAAAVATWSLLPQAGQTTEILVAKHRIELGQTLTPDMVKSVKYDSDLVPETALKSLDDLPSAIAAATLPAGTPLTSGILVNSHHEIPPGFANVSVTFADQAAASVLTPGIYIRVFATAEFATEEFHTDAFVAAITETEDSVTGSTRVVTLTVPEDQASQLARLATGGLSFAQVNNS